MLMFLHFFFFFEMCFRFQNEKGFVSIVFPFSEKLHWKQKSVHLLKRYWCHDNFSKVNLSILSNIKYIGISNDTRSAPYTLVTSDLRRPSWHEKKSLFENRRHDTLVGLPTKFHTTRCTFIMDILLSLLY